MKLTVTTFQTLDGVMQAPSGPPEDPSGGFEHGGWLVSLADAEMGACMDETLAPAEAFLLGRFTDQMFAITSAGTVIAVYAFDGSPSCGIVRARRRGSRGGLSPGWGGGGDVAEWMIEANGVPLCAEAFGDPADPPILLVTGMGGSMLWWEEGFCRRIAAGGRFVVGAGRV